MKYQIIRYVELLCYATSKKSAEKIMKPRIKLLQAFSVAFGFDIKEIMLSYTPESRREDTIGVEYFWAFRFDRIDEAGRMVYLASAIELFCDLNGVKLSDVEFKPIPDESDSE